MTEDERLGVTIKIVRVVAVLFAVGGLMLLWYGARHVAGVRKTLAWPTVSGTVEQAGILTRIASKNGPSYAAQVTYGYTVGGETYSADKIGFDREWKTKREIPEAEISQYWPGQQVTVHYNPEKPGEAVLKAGTNDASWTFFIIGGAFIFCAAIDYWLVPWLTVVLRRRKPENTEKRLWQ